MNDLVPDSGSASNLIWIDLEMTGLDTVADTIIEIATIVTDRHLNELAEGPDLAIGQPKTVMDSMDEWNTRQNDSYNVPGLRRSLLQNQTANLGLRAASPRPFQTLFSRYRCDRAECARDGSGSPRRPLRARKRVPSTGAFYRRDRGI